MNTPTKARFYSLSLYDRHLEILTRVAEQNAFRNRPRYRSATLQFILEEYARLVNLDTDDTPADQQQAA
jgi:hypothetical protein